MAFLEFKNVRIAGISAGVPQNIASNLHPDEFDAVSSDYAPEDFVKTTGVMERRVSFDLTTSDLCYAAAEQFSSRADRILLSFLRYSLKTVTGKESFLNSFAHAIEDPISSKCLSISCIIFVCFYLLEVKCT